VPEVYYEVYYASHYMGSPLMVGKVGEPVDGLTLDGG
jgi:hypothetical protein